MSEHREDFLLKLEQKLCGLFAEELLRVCELCNITAEKGKDVTSRTRRSFVKLIIQFCERDELLQSEDEGMSVLLELNDVLESLIEARSVSAAAVGAAAALLPSVADAAAETTHQEEQTASSERDTAPGEDYSPSSEAPLERQAALRTTTPNSGTPRRGRDSISHSCYNASSTGFRRDFRINGHVGESTAKDTLSFSSLEHQIESGLRKGYPETEVVEAVVRAISPGLKLRSYLEGKVDLTLTNLRQILRAHYAEKDATVLYQQLTKATQGTNETPLEFLIRVLDLRQKILFASERTQSSLKYNKELVQSQCFQSIMTGLLNDNIRAEMRMYLQDENSSDELLLLKMQSAQYSESERALKTKANKSTSRAGLNVVEQFETQDDPCVSQPVAKQNKPAKDNSLFSKIEESNTAIRELTGQVASLVQTVQRDIKKESDKQTKTYEKSTQRQKRQCTTCQEENQDCNHCFKCGSDSHWAKGCRVGRSLKQGNRQKL